MRSIRTTKGLVASLAVMALLAAGCTKNDKVAVPPTGSTSPGAAAVKTDVGVSATEIHLGVLTDLSGQFNALGKGSVQGLQLYWDQTNAAGGICGRKVTLDVKDHGYNAQTAVSLYAGMKDGVLGLNQSLGSPMTTALLPSLLADHMLTEPVSWASSLLKNPYIIMDGTTYDLEIINGVSWLMKEKGLKDGDTVGYIYQEGEYGQNGFTGGQYMAKQHNLKLIEQKIKGTDTDMTSQIAAIKAAGAKFILMTSGPKQSASAASVAASQSYDVTILSSNPGFAATILDGPAKAALEKSFYVVGSAAPFSGTAPGVGKVRDLYIKKYPTEVPNASIIFGYAQAQIFAKVLTAACSAGDLTRDGLLKASQTLNKVDTDGLVATLDYTKAGAPPSREVYVAQANSAEKGGLKEIQPLFTSPDAQTYQPA